jgi:hypothetical protein
MKKFLAIFKRNILVAEDTDIDCESNYVVDEAFMGKIKKLIESDGHDEWNVITEEPNGVITIDATQYCPTITFSFDENVDSTYMSETKLAKYLGVVNGDYETLTVIVKPITEDVAALLLQIGAASDRFLTVK